MRSLISVTSAFLLTWALNSVSAHPAGHGLVNKHRRQNYDDPALYANVNWKTVNYNLPVQSPAPVAAAPNQPAAPAQNKNAVSKSQAPQQAPAPSPTSAATAGNESNQSQDQGTTHPDNNPAPAVKGSGGKRGVAYNGGSPSVSIFNAYSDVTWAYDWDSSAGAGAGNMQFVPMLWGEKSYGSWAGNVKAAIQGGGTHYLLGFNEPDDSNQAGMAVGAAVTAFQNYMTPYASQNVQLGSPAVTSSEEPGKGLSWLQPFLQQCADCKISFIAVHWYGCNNGCSVADDVQAFKSHIQQAMGVANGKPLWITEFQRTGPGEDQFLNQVLPWLDGQQGVARYAYFMAQQGFLTNGNALSALGKQYVA